MFDPKFASAFSGYVGFPSRSRLTSPRMVIVPAATISLAAGAETSSPTHSSMFPPAHTPLRVAVAVSAAPPDGRTVSILFSTRNTDPVVSRNRSSAADVVSAGFPCGSVGVSDVSGMVTRTSPAVVFAASRFSS